MRFRTVTTIRASEISFSELPDQLREQFRPEEVSAYIAGTASFKDAVTKLDEPLLVSLFQCFDNDHPLWVYIESEDCATNLIWFGFSHYDLVHQPQFRLQSPKGLPMRVPPRVRRMYGVFGGIRFDSHLSGGLLPPEKVMSLSSISSLPRKKCQMDGTENEEYYAFLSYGNGDYLCLMMLVDVRCSDHERRVAEEADLDFGIDHFLEQLLERPDLRTMFG